MKIEQARVTLLETDKKWRKILCTSLPVEDNE